MSKWLRPHLILILSILFTILSHQKCSASRPPEEIVEIEDLLQGQKQNAIAEKAVENGTNKSVFSGGEFRINFQRLDEQFPIGSFQKQTPWLEAKEKRRVMASLIARFWTNQGGFFPRNKNTWLKVERETTRDIRGTVTTNYFASVQLPQNSLYRENAWATRELVVGDAPGINLWLTMLLQANKNNYEETVHLLKAMVNKPLSSTRLSNRAIVALGIREETTGKVQTLGCVDLIELSVSTQGPKYAFSTDENKHWLWLSVPFGDEGTISKYLRKCPKRLFGFRLMRHPLEKRLPKLNFHEEKHS